MQDGKDRNRTALLALKQSVTNRTGAALIRNDKNLGREHKINSGSRRPVFKTKMFKLSSLLIKISNPWIIPEKCKE